VLFRQQSCSLNSSSAHLLHAMKRTDDCTFCLQRPGSEIAVYGTVTCESDIPKKCFSTTFCADDRQAMDYFNCKSCKINCEIVSRVCKLYVRLLATKAEERNKAGERTRRQGQTDTIVHKTNL